MIDAPRYPVGTIAEMAAIPIEARARFLAELPDMLATLDIIRQANVDMEGVCIITPQTPIWVDDSLGTRTVTITYEATGESLSSVTKIKGVSA